MLKPSQLQDFACSSAQTITGKNATLRTNCHQPIRVISVSMIHLPDWSRSAVAAQVTMKSNFVWTHFRSGYMQVL